MAGGLVVGVVLAVGIGGGFHLALPWIVNVGLAKLTLAASLGLMAGGAFVRRLGLRREHGRELERASKLRAIR